MSYEKQYLTKLKDVIFTDAKILSFDKTEDALVIEFRDYANSELEITLYNVSDVQTSEDMYYEIADYQLIENAESKTLILLNDENRTIFSVKFKESSVIIL